MSIGLQEEIFEDVVIFSVEGKLVVGPEVVVLHDRIKNMVGNGVVRVVVDFSNVSWFGSAMLGVLAASYTTLQTAGGGIRIVGASQKVKEIMDVTRLSDVFETMSNIEEAVASLRSCISMEA